MVSCKVAETERVWIRWGTFHDLGADGNSIYRTLSNTTLFLTATASLNNKVNKE